MNPDESLKSLLVSFQHAGESEPARQLSEYLRLLRKWNSKINLTASSEWESLSPLFSEAFWAASLYDASGQFHLDIGSGAGFPALPLKILRPHIHLEMVECRTKRAVFLETVVLDLGLANVLVHNSRIEDFLAGRDSRGRWTVVSWKGLRLNRSQFSHLRDGSTRQVEFWIFHGKELPLEDPQVSLLGLKLAKTSLCPSSDSRYLSIYRY